ncbi:putative NIF3 family GTP cyclohydrolase 1 type 2 [Deinococcus metalli]|uniref:Putative NIF3 family GTP cyclohydrolase 1 type 2 n=1 Tax=Deinococcus metalli TaxID=1141878 RepID=A0A7W8KAW8_9DEIO|nr:Nif3-like dinuclear metal center hexameric protein [Deinococcus metalli]MBB5374897.1 putative NIF3 family GTP cyclohydrolase 1 type 2 [Deinococcus metalli]GHF32896.1 hypothetical protein GCM10017781_07000 [Deinococcus metalli]
MSPATLTGLAGWLRAELDEPEALRRPGPEPVARLALALEPKDVPDDLAADALFLHRSRHVDGRWPGMGIVAAHDGFDAQLTTGPNRRLAAVLGWQDVREVTWEGRVVGVTARPPQATWEALRSALHAELGGEDTSIPPAVTGAPRVALMNAMNPALMALAADLGVTVYLTGELRPSAVAAAREHGVGVVALGHRRTELWGLRTLARELVAAFPGLETRVYDQP